MRLEESGKGLKRTTDSERETDRKKTKISHLNGTTEEGINGRCDKETEQANDSSGTDENIPMKEENESGNKTSDRDHNHTCRTDKKRQKDQKREKGKSRKEKRTGKPPNGTLQEKPDTHKKKRKHHEVDVEPKKKKGSKGGEDKGGKIKTKKGEKKEEEKSKWKWWEESSNSNDGQKWTTLEHRGPLFPPEYEPLPNNVSFYYGGEPIKLSLAAEEIATFYAKMLDHEYTTKEAFQKNFFGDWKEVMSEDERKTIKKLSKCDFSEIHKYFVSKSEEKKNMSKEEKQVLKEETNKLTEEYGYCLLDSHREKIGNFRVEPPGLFRGRGEHPKMGKLKRRIQPEDIIINCSKDSKIPAPPSGHKWKRVQHDNTVTWLASWVENVQNHTKYIMLNPSSKLKVRRHALA